MGVELYDYQIDAIRRMRNGCILCGGVGSGKSRTSLAYYFLQNGGKLDPFEPMDDVNVKDLYIITTARKRDQHEWEGDMCPFLLQDLGSQKVIIDSWNNVSKYKDVEGAFFIFDEQRVVGKGTWVKAFLKIAKANSWILLSATPGDTWMDYVPVFIANGFYKNRTQFNTEHVIYSRYGNFPKVERYINTGRLIRLRDRILVDMDFQRKTEAHHEDIYVDYNKIIYKDTMKERWNPYSGEPIVNASELCYTLRRIVNSDETRQTAMLEIIEKHPKAIVFYNFDYELDILKSIDYGEGFELAEWNGHKHQPVPTGDKWVYFVQYTAGAEGWNCITTDTIIFFSQNYSYKIMVQSSGRIDRLNTPFKDLYYYHLKSHSSIDLAIGKALKSKKKFNETKFCSF